MKTKNLIFTALAFLMMFSITESKAQSTNDMTYRGVGYYDVLDSSFVSDRNKQQQDDFLNYQYSHPARPKNQWELAIKGGAFNLVGADVPYTYFAWNGKMSGNLGLSLRKAIGYGFSFRFEYDYGVAKGTGWQLSTAYTDVNSTTQWTNTKSGHNYGGKRVLPNYRTVTNAGYLDLIYNIGNINFHKSNPRWSTYLFAGLGYGTFNVFVDAEDASGNKYDFEGNLGSISQSYDNRNNFLSAAEGYMDGDYETDALSDQGKKGYNVQNTKPLASAGIGIQYLFTPRFALGVEDRLTYWNSDILDGQANHDGYKFSKTNDWTNAVDFTLGFNIGNKNKRILPLWWVNPTDYIYSELTDPRHLRTQIDYTDTDGDGVLDVLDQEPNTPAGCPVNTHGVSLDTDGDGVPDCRDKQLITPTYCFPVDRDGVGDCPCPEGCGTVATCNLASRTLAYSGASTDLTSRNLAALDDVYNTMTAAPDCKAVIIGYGMANKREIQRSWDRVNKIINYLADKGISRDRFIFQYGRDGDANMVTIRGANADETGDSSVPPPFPNLMR